MKFDNFYGGHVEMKNLGFPVLPANDRHVSDEELASAFDEARAMAQLMDTAGYGG